MADHLTEAESIIARARQMASVQDRQSFIERVCASDPKLLATVQSLMRKDAGEHCQGDTPHSAADTDSAVGVRHSAVTRHFEPTRELGPSTADATGQVRSAGGEQLSATGGYLPESSSSGVERPIEIPGYEVLGILGRGGMGVVYRARQLKLKRLVALKMILAGNHAAAEDLSRFRREAEAVARLQHPNIVQIYDVNEHEGQPFIAFEFVDGETLSDYAGKGPLPPREAAELVESLARAMQYAHEQGVVHRDLKPGNVLIGRTRAATGSDSWSGSSSSSRILVRSEETPTGLVPKVTDFGLAKQLDVDGDVTRTGAVIGTPNYMAPEQAAGEREVGPLVDVYSLGAILYALLCNRPPFRGKTSMETVMLVQNDEPPPPTRVQPGIPKDLETICLKCLEKDPLSRYASAEELANDLRRFLAGDPVHASPPSLLYKWQKFSRRHFAALWTAAIVLLVIFAASVSTLVFFSRARERDLAAQQLAELNQLTELSAAHGPLFGTDYRLRHDAIRQWVERAERMLARLPLHRRALRRLRDRGELVKAAEGGSDSWHFATIDMQSRHQHLAQLVAGLESLGDDRNGALAVARQWMQRSPSPAQIEEKWQQANDSISETYGGLRIENRGALFPLGKNRQSGLWEFVDLATGLAPARGLEQNEPMIDAESGVIFVWIPGGNFLMGSLESEIGHVPDESQHPTGVSPFLISKYEVTQSQWQRVMDSDPSYKGIGPLFPVHQISWLDCQEFCEKTGYHLPTEAQWEFACRAGTTTPFSGNGNVDEMGWHPENADNTAHPVGQKLPNHFGLYDMHGNLLEWCLDVYAEDFYSRPEAQRVDPVHLDESDPLASRDDKTGRVKRVLRGGGYTGEVAYCRSADRYMEKFDMRWETFGVRPVFNIQRSANP